MYEHKFKYEIATQEIRRDINNNIFHGKKLPSDEELMDKYKIGRRTLRHALDILANEGTIARIQRKGTLIMNRQKSLTINQQIAVVMSHPHDTNDIMYQAIIQEIVERNYFCITTLFDQGERDPEKRCKAIERLNILLNSPIAGILALGDGYYRYPFMDGHSQLPSVFLKTFESYEPIPDRAVFCDFEFAGYLATSHLAKLGHRRIVLFFFRPGYLERDLFPTTTQSPFNFEQGYRRAMNEFGLQEFAQSVERDSDEKNNELIIRGLLSGKERATGVVCIQDSNAAKFVDIALDMRIKVPEELAVIGTYNTIWGQKSRVPLTSISLEEAKVGKEAVNILFSSDPKSKLIKIPPKLVIRDSCGGKARF
jgi:GntR family transcriptional regulator of arabinose operon